jgi:hypothetical protein
MTWWQRVLGLMAVSVLVLASCSSGSSDSVADVSVTDLSPGDCFDDQSAGGEILEEFGDVPMVDCDKPHDNEAYAVIDLPDGAYPGDDAITEQGFEGCLPLFEGYVGSSYETSRLEIFPITPVAEVWAGGDRRIICALFDIDLAKLTGSMRDSGE